MKKCISLLLLLQSCLLTFGQQTPDSLITKEDYLKKSKSQNAAGRILLGAGIGCILGFANSFELNIGYGGSSSKKNNTLATVLGVGGLAAITGSIISFVSSGKNKRRAYSISLTHETLMLPMEKASIVKTQPAINVKFKL